MLMLKNLLGEVFCYNRLTEPDFIIIKELFCVELCFAAVQWLRLWSIVDQDSVQLNAGTQQRLLCVVL